jgi:hypothetical protein
MTIHAAAYAKYHWYGSHTKTTLLHVPVWASVGVPPFGGRMSLFTVCRSGWPVQRAGVAGGLTARVLASRVSPNRLPYAGLWHLVSFNPGR